MYVNKSSLEIINYIKQIIRIKNFDTGFFFLLLRPMRFELNKVILFTAGLLCCNSLFASNTPPPPLPPGPPGPSPIDSELFLLLFVSIILGFYKIYKHKKSFKLS